MWRLSVALLCAVFITDLRAAPGASVGLYELCVNGRCGDPVWVLAGDDAHWVDADALDALGVETGSWPSRHVDGVRYVNPVQHHPDVRLQIDQPSLRINLALPGAFWPSQRIGDQRRSHRPIVAPSGDRSGYLDYTLYKHDQSRPGAFGELGLVQGAWLLRNSFGIEGSKVRRQLTALEFEQWNQRRRWTLGDQYVSTGDAFGSQVLIGGLGVASAWELDPYRVTFPGADIRGVMQAPGSIDIYANGQLIAHHDMQAGAFNVEDLVLTQGSNDLRIVVNDPFAGPYEIQSDFYSSPRLLARGLAEYAYRLGQVRGSPLQQRYRGGSMFSAWHRYGLTDWLTGGLRYERIDRRSNGGISVDLRMPLGSLGLGAARSQDAAGISGEAWRLDYSWITRRISVGAGLLEQDASYRPLTWTPVASTVGSILENRYATTSVALPGSASVSFRHSRALYQDRSPFVSNGVRLGMRAGAGGRLNLGFERRSLRDGRVDRVWQMTWYLSRGNVGYSAAATHGRDDGSDYTFGAQRSHRSPEGGWGWRAEGGEQQGEAYALAQYDLDGRHGRVDATLMQRGPRDSYSLRYTGSLLWSAGQVFAARSGTHGYALVQTPGASGVAIQREHQRVGTTNDKGMLLVSGLLPYQANRISVERQALDIGTDVRDPERYVSVPRYGVARVTFELQAIAAVQAYLTVAQDGRLRRLKYGTAVLEGNDETAPARIAEDGQIYLEGVAAGSYILKVTSDDGLRYRCRLEVPSGEALAWLGEVQCEAY